MFIEVSSLEEIHSDTYSKENCSVRLAVWLHWFLSMASSRLRSLQQDVNRPRSNTLTSRRAMNRLPPHHNNLYSMVSTPHSFTPHWIHSSHLSLTHTLTHLHTHSHMPWVDSLHTTTTSIAWLSPPHSFTPSLISLAHTLTPSFAHSLTQPCFHSLTCLSSLISRLSCLARNNKHTHNYSHIWPLDCKEWNYFAFVIVCKGPGDDAVILISAPFTHMHFILTSFSLLLPHSLLPFLLLSQMKKVVISGMLPVTLDEAIYLTALQMHIEVRVQCHTQLSGRLLE